MGKFQKGLFEWGVFILFAIGTATNTSLNSVQVPQNTIAIQQQANVSSTIINQSTVTKDETVVDHYQKEAQVQESPAPVKTYVNTSGTTIRSPTYYNSQLTGSIVKCRDGTYSFSQSRRGTCSHHRWSGRMAIN